MWTKRSFLLYTRLSLRGTKPRLRLWLPLALYVPQQLLLATEGLLALLPCAFGAWARRATDTLHRVLLALMGAPPQGIADVDLAKGTQRIRVVVRTCGFGGGDEL